MCSMYPLNTIIYTGGFPWFPKWGVAPNHPTHGYS